MKPLPSNDESIHYRKSPVLYAFLFFGLTFLLTMMGQVTQAYASKNFPLMTWLPYAQFVVGTPPSIAGLLLLILIYRWQGLSWLLTQFNPAKICWIWFVLAGFIIAPFEWTKSVVVVISLAILVSSDIRHRVIRMLDWRPYGWALVWFPLCIAMPVAVECLVMLISGTFSESVTMFDSKSLFGYVRASLLGGLMGAGIFEEIGWRGFALPHLQRRFKPLFSSLIVGAAWGLWHFPNYIYRTPLPWSEIAIYMWTVIALSIVFTWIYNLTGGSLLACICLHGGINAQPSLIAWPEEWWSTQEATIWIPLIRGSIYWIVAIILFLGFRRVIPSPAKNFWQNHIAVPSRDVVGD